MKKGITMVVLMVIVVIMLILISTITIVGSNTLNMAKKMSFASEVEMLQEEVDTYRVNNNGEFPISDFINVNLSNASENVKSQFVDNKEEVLNDEVNLAKIDYQKIKINNLTYGYGKTGNDDLYVVSPKTGIVYYAKGLKVGSITYYTLTDELKKLIQYNKKNDEINTDDAIIFDSSNNNWTNQSIDYTIKVPKKYSNITVKADENIVNIDNTVIDDSYNIYKIQIDQNCIINVSYTNEENTSKNIRHSVMNIDKISPSIVADNIKGTNTTKKYIKVSALDSASGVKVVKYDTDKINNDYVGRAYLVSNGKDVKNDVIEVDSTLPYITLYVEDNAGNYNIQLVSLEK